MKFTAQVGGLLKGLKPVLVVATKGILKDYQFGGLITLNVVNGYIQAIADGGKVSATNEIGNNTYNIDYVCDTDGTVTVNAVDLENALSSFAPSDKVSCELLNGSTVRISSITDSDEAQTVPVVGTPCQFHDINADGQKPTKLSIRRDIFQNYASKIMFAYGDQEQYKQFTYWVLRSFGTNSLRFVSGTGTIFAVVEVDGANMTDAKGDIKMLFPNEQSTIPLRIQLESGRKRVP
jgi:DNA polymerase III sliding clamp (beta) subunit (PCNA family)